MFKPCLIHDTNPFLMLIFRGPTFQCSCPIGYTASFCEISMSNNPCNDNPCSNGATCTLQSLSNYTCSCPLGWKGNNFNLFYCKSSQMTMIFILQWALLNVITLRPIETVKINRRIILTGQTGFGNLWKIDNLNQMKNINCNQIN
jgi:hypothetical protein